MQKLSSLFSKLLAGVLAFFALLMPVQRSDEVQLTLPEITVATESFEVTISNQSDDAIAYGLDAFSLEQRTLLGWKPLSKTGDYVVAAVMLSLSPGESGTLHVNLPLVYGKTLRAGVYRFNFHYFKNYEKAQSSVTFVVRAG